MDPPRAGDDELVVRAGGRPPRLAQGGQALLVVVDVVFRHGVAAGDEVAAVEVGEVAEAVVHHHEHLFCVAAGAEDEEVVVYGSALDVTGS